MPGSSGTWPKLQGDVVSASSQEFKERPFIIKLEHNVLHPLTYDLIDLVPFLGFLSGNQLFYRHHVHLLNGLQGVDELEHVGMTLGFNLGLVSLVGMLSHHLEVLAILHINPPPAGLPLYAGVELQLRISLGDEGLDGSLSHGRPSEGTKSRRQDVAKGKCP